MVRQLIYFSTAGNSSGCRQSASAARIPTAPAARSRLRLPLIWQRVRLWKRPFAPQRSILQRPSGTAFLWGPDIARYITSIGSGKRGRDRGLRIARSRSMLHPLSSLTRARIRWQIPGRRSRATIFPPLPSRERSRALRSPDREIREWVGPPRCNRLRRALHPRESWSSADRCVGCQWVVCRG